MQNLKKLERAYVVFKKNKNNKEKNKKFFDHIESLQIKQAIDKYEKNPEDKDTH